MGKSYDSFSHASGKGMSIKSQPDNKTFAGGEVPDKKWSSAGNVKATRLPNGGAPRGHKGTRYS